MRLAKPSDFDEIVAVFKPMKGKYFPHLRQDLLKIRLSNSNVVYEDGVVIQFAPYKIRRKIGNVQAQVGDVHLEKIVTVKQGNGSAFTVMQDFLASINANVWLTVRADNERARAFYLKNSMVEVGDISWENGNLPGKIYFYEKRT